MSGHAAGREGSRDLAETIDTVLFDLGRVLVGWDPRRPYAGRMAPDAVEEFFAAIDFPAFNHLQDAGRSWGAARAALVERDPRHGPALDIYLDHFTESLTGPVPGSAELVADLRAAGLRLLGLSNWSAELFHHAQESAPAITLLEHVFVSGQVGVAKPDPQIYRLAIERFRLDAARTVFVDDMTRNVQAAAAAGLVAVQFTGAARLRSDLRALGVPVAGRQRRRPPGARLRAPGATDGDLD